MSASKPPVELRFYVPDTPDQDSPAGSSSGGLNSKWRTWWRSGKGRQDEISTGRSGEVFQELDESWWNRRKVFQE